MRYYTLAWFYNAKDTLLHIKSLQFDADTPHRAPNHLFGGTEINEFHYEVNLHQEKRTEDLSWKTRDGINIPFFRDYIHESVNGCAMIGMENNLHMTELWGHLTRGEPLSKIIVRIYEIQETGKLEPYIEYSFKECHLFLHKIQTHEYQIRYTYCCCDILFYEGNRFASHQRCVPFEPNESDKWIARNNESYAHDDYYRKQNALEKERLKIAPAQVSNSSLTVHRYDVAAVSEMDGQKIFPDGLDDVVFHIVEKPQSVDELIDSLYKDPSDVTRTHFRRVNSHLKNGYVSPAQVVLLSAQDSIRMSQAEKLMIPELEKIENYRLNMNINHTDFATNFIDYGNLAGLTAMGVSFGTTYFQKHVEQIQKVLNELQHAYSTSYRSAAGNLRLEEFKAYRTKKFNELNALITKGMQSKIYGGIAGSKMRHKLRLNPGLIEHDWRIKKSKILPTLSQFYENTALFNRTVNRISYLAIPLSAYETHTNIVEACREGEAACTKSKYVEWSGFAGSVAGGGMGSYLAGTLALVVAAGTGGLALVGITAAFAITGGYLGAKGGNMLSSAGGKALHDLNYQQYTPEIEKQPVHELIWTPIYFNIGD